MKKYLFILLPLFFVFVTLASSAQDNQWKAVARGQSDHGHWLVEQHKDTAEMQRVFFYTKNNTLLYKEEVRGARIKVNKESTLKRLNTLLAKVAAEWEKTNVVIGQQLVLEQFN